MHVTSDMNIIMKVTTFFFFSIFSFTQVIEVPFFFFFFFQDESALIWYSGNEEKQLKISQVSRIIPGQRTVSFYSHSFFLRKWCGVASQATVELILSDLRKKFT